MAKRGDEFLKIESHRGLLRTIAAMHRQGKPILVRTLSATMRRPIPTLHAQLDRFVEAGFVVDAGEPFETRIVELTSVGREASRRLGAPICGFVPAGLTRAVPESDGRDGEGEQVYLETWDDVLPPDEKHLVLVVRGDSMIGDFIQEGDEVHLERGGKLNELEDGEIAAVLVGGDYEATLKHIHLDAENGMVTLRASNPAYSDIVAPREDVRLVGTVRGIIRLNPKKVNRK